MRFLPLTLLVLMIAGVGTAAAHTVLSVSSSSSSPSSSSSSSSPSARRDAPPPNILFILSDDLGYGDFEPFSVNEGDRRLSTPNVLQFASESMRFTHAYAGAPVCAPSRCTLMTGKHSGHCTVRENGPTLNSSDTTVAEVLQRAGYTTALFGKWGLSQDTPTDDRFPTRAGFDHYHGQVDQNLCHDYYPSWLWLNASKEEIAANANASVVRCGPDHSLCKWSSDIWVNDTVNFLHTTDKSKPFFLMLSVTSPHAGSVGSEAENDVPVPRVSTSPYASKSWPKVEIDFATAVYLQDQQIGRVLQALRDEGLDNSTIVFLASDNGAHNEGGHSYQFFNSSGILRGFKRSLHEGGHRTPLMVRWPGHTPAGAVSEQQWAFYDFMRTAADIAGYTASLPDNDGYSLLPTLQGGAQPQPAFIYHEYCAPNENQRGWGQAVRMGNFSAICIGPQPAAPTDIPCASPLLYDLVKDPSQQTDVAAQHAEVVAAARSVMQQQHVTGHYCGGA